MADYRIESKDCDLNVLDDILENIDDHAYTDDEDERLEEDLIRVDPKKPQSSSWSVTDYKSSRGRGRANLVRNNSLHEKKSGLKDDDNLKKLEQERKRLELENEEIKRQVEELKRQELLIEQASKKGDSEVDETFQEVPRDSEEESDIDKASVSSHESNHVDQREHSSDEIADQKEDSRENDRSRRRKAVASTSPNHHKRHRSHSRSSQSKRRRRVRETSLSGSRRKHSPSNNHGHRRGSLSSYEFSSKLQYIFRDAKYFLIKSSNHENVALAQAKGVWSSPPPNEMRINQAFRSHSNVILIFSVKESGKFQGFARVAAQSDRNHPPIRWILPVGISARMLSGVFTLDWVNRNDLGFEKTLHIRNSLNDGCAVKIGRDGQEIDPVSGEELCRLFLHDRRIDLNAIAQKSKQALKLNGLSSSSVEMNAHSPSLGNAAASSYHSGSELLHHWSFQLDWHERHSRHDKHQDGHRKDSKWSDYRSRSLNRRPSSAKATRYGHHRARDNHQHNGPPDDFRDFHHKMGLAPPLPLPGFMPPPVYGHIHPPPPPPPFMFDRFSRAQHSRHLIDKRSGRHHESDLDYRNSSRDGRYRPYERQPRDRR